MLKINSTKFGSVMVNSQRHHDVLIIGDKIIPRDYQMLKKKYGTGHKIDKSELKLLLSRKPDYIILSTGQNGSLKIDEITKKEIENKNIILIILKTPKAIRKYNKIIVDNKKVNILVHTTC